ARATRIPTIWTQSDHRAPYGGLMLRKLPPIAEDHSRWQGEPSFELYPRMLQPREGKLEYHIVKHKFDACFETALDAIVRSHDVETVIMIGAATNACCESTAGSAFMRDYKVLFPSDLNATFDDAEQQDTVNNF